MNLYLGKYAVHLARSCVSRLRRSRAARGPGWLAIPVGICVALGGAIDGEPGDPEPVFAQAPAARHGDGDLSILTYNVEGLPWPLASGRPQALGRIADRLARLRRSGRQPQVVVLQEAFTAEAKAIGRRAGYPFVVEGPYARAAPRPEQAARRDWHLGETRPAAVDSGLVLLSDLPVRSVERVAFPPEDCAGYDCLAAKGVLMVELETPGRGPVMVATTHLNCQGASGAPKARTTEAFGRQVAFLGTLLSRARQRGLPVVVAGDFNQGRRPQRIALLHTALDPVLGEPARDALSRHMDRDPAAIRRDAAFAELTAIRTHARDLQFAFDGSRTRIAPAAVEVPFGRETDGSMLSDHMGYTVHYRLDRKPGWLSIASR